MLLMYVTFS